MGWLGKTINKEVIMTLEELKAEAKKHGYKLIKEKPYIRLSHCICGHKSISQWIHFNGGGYSFGCRKCDFESPPCKTKYEAKLKWNECVEQARKENENDTYREN